MEGSRIGLFDPLSKTVQIKYFQKLHLLDDQDKRIVPTMMFPTNFSQPKIDVHSFLILMPAWTIVLIFCGMNLKQLVSCT